MSQQQVKPQYSTGWILLLALFTSLGPLSIDMYLPALPQMAQDFNVSTQQVANSLPAYFFGLAVGQLIYGPISDRIGRKKPLYFGMTLFACASLLCVLANDQWSLIAARVLQALGGCVGVVMARAAIRDKLDIQGSAQAFASMMIVMGIAPVLAPTFGAWILYFFEWHYVFIVLMLIGFFCLACVHFFFEETLPEERRLKLNAGQVLQLYATIFKDRSFYLPMLAGCLTGAALFAYIGSASAVLMDQYHLNEQQFAYAFGFNALGIMFVSFLNKKLANKFSVVQRLQLGGLNQIFGSVVIVISGLLVDVPLWIVMVGLFLTVSGIGFTGPNAMALAMSKQGERAGTASAIMGSTQFACGLIGGILLNFLVFNHVLNMGILMLGFTVAGGVAIWLVKKELQ
ncbi:multidrug effflux MFS transporter [Acinetobacter sp. CFCC 10889]|uniref:multidrug effflux MFS transporter n=1 Tax=Acinetobacter sp. CFCC 10889 TaxID=1775557 RepID=UPI000DCFC38D|nr:multidrug effflux MFS transporter [Acinetobacter sp. CFCC 10889]